MPVGDDQRPREAPVNGPACQQAKTALTRHDTGSRLKVERTHIKRGWILYFRIREALMADARLRRTCLAAFIAFVLLSSVPAAQQTDPSRFWAQWRGPHATGVSSTANPPLEWSETKNIKWKVEIPGRGSSSPIVWGDRTRAHGDSVGVQERPSMRRAAAPAARRAPIRRRDRSQDRPHALGNASPPSRSRTRLATSRTALGVKLADHRRSDAVCLF